MKRLDRNDKELKNGDTIDIHQTVNGCSKFLVLDCSENLDIEYYEDWAMGRKYEYDKKELLDDWNGESEFTIIGNIK